MALEKTVLTVYGVEAKNAYHKIDVVTIHEKATIKFAVCSYFDREKQSFLSTMYACRYDLEGENPIKQAYEHLKTLPEFEGATDC